ncbi:MAG: hypothetical protein Kow00109_04390 [Acidobacteriota bacterium]
MLRGREYELREQKQRLIEKAEKIIKTAECENRSLTAGERREWDDLMRQIDDINEELKLLDRAKEEWRRQKGLAPESGFITRDQRLAPEHPEVTAGQFFRALVTGPRNEDEARALGESSGVSGGYLVPGRIFSQVLDTVRAKSRVFQAGASMYRLEPGQTQIVTVASDPTVTWLAEGSQLSESDPSFSSVTLNPQVCAVLTRVSEQLIHDGVNVERTLERTIAGAVSAELDRVMLYGSGTAPEPKGLVNWTGIQAVEVGSGNGAALTDFGPLIDGVEAVLTADCPEVPRYAIMHPRTLADIEALADSNGQPLQRPTILQRMEFLDSTKVPIDETVGTSTDCSHILLGSWPDLVLAVSWPMRVEVLKERYRDFLQIGFLVHTRVDVVVLRSGWFCKIYGIRPSS